ncbi:MAG: hypothetical protein IT196_26215 [Acidimicrobiales bacterium]|nr:hypothetical protein [Acidimicrobiales bacterium]
MKLNETVSQIADFLWDVLTDDRSARNFQEDPAGALADAGHDNVTSEELEAAIDRLSSRLPSDSLDQVEPLRAISCGLPSASGVGPAQAFSSGVGPAQAIRVPQQPQVVTKVVRETQVVHDTKVVREQPVNQVTNNNVTQNNIVNEGDKIVDNRTITEINARGDVDFDQKIDNTTVIADHGGVAADGDIEDSAINTGRNDGIIAGDDVELENSVVGDGNTQLNDSEVGAFSGKGDATNIEGENVNAGSGDLLAVDTDGGEAQVVNGSGNDTTGDIDVDASGSEGPVNVVAGDGNDANALQDNSTTIEDSLNTDNSVEDSGNTTVDDSLNQVTEDNDTSTVQVDDSLNQTAEDNDTTTIGVDVSETDNSFVSDDDTLTSDASFQEAEVDLLGSDNDVDLDFDDDAI